MLLWLLAQAKRSPHKDECGMTETDSETWTVKRYLHRMSKFSDETNKRHRFYRSRISCKLVQHEQCDFTRSDHCKRKPDLRQVPCLKKWDHEITHHLQEFCKLNIVWTRFIAQLLIYRQERAWPSKMTIYSTFFSALRQINCCENSCDQSLMLKWVFTSFKVNCRHQILPNKSPVACRFYSPMCWYQELDQRRSSAKHCWGSL